MGKYDIEKEYCEEYDVTIAALCRELMDEYEVSSGLDAPAEETFRDKFKNNDKSGLLDKLKINLNFDMQSIAGSSPSELFDMLKILKQLYYIEKAGDPKGKVYSNNTRIKITNILAKPRLANIKIDFSKTSVYGDTFDDLFDKIKSTVDDADERYLRLKNINSAWEYMTEWVFNYVITNEAIQEPKKALDELNRIYKVLTERILKRLQNKKVEENLQSEGVMKTFFNILVCHRLLCNEVDRINISYQTDLSKTPSKEYVDKFKGNGECEFSWESLPSVTDQLLGKKHDPNAQRVLWFFSYGNQIANDDIENYKYAITKSRTVASWIENFKKTKLTAENIPLNILSTIVQEIVAIKKNGDKIQNDYYGYKNREKSMLAAIKKPEAADAVVLQAWIKRLENRLAVNYGVYDQIRMKREIETTIYEIKKIIYSSYHNLDDMEFVNKFLFHFVQRSIISRKEAIIRHELFREKIANNLQGIAKGKEFLVVIANVDVLDMYKEFRLDIYNIEDIVAADISRQISEFYNEKSNIIIRDMLCEIEICYNEYYYRLFHFCFRVDRKNNELHFLYFYEVRSDADIIRMKQLGLGKFKIIDTEETISPESRKKPGDR